MSISPVSATPGGASFTLTVNGVNFVSTSTVQWNGTALTTTYVSATQLTATVPQADIASGGTGWITVSSPTPGGGVSNVFYLPVASSVSTLTMTTKTAAVGPGPFQIAEGDFNGDGILDLAVSNFNTNTVSVLLGNADGTFQTQATFTTVANPFGMAVGDINHDGKIDMVVGNDNFNLTVGLGNGNGTFSTSTVSNPNCMLDPVLADVNGDGNLDIVAGNYCGNGILVFLGNGNGTFQTATTQASAANSVFQLVVGDFNGDGKLDVATVDQNSIIVYLGTGNGNFGTGTIISSPLSQPISIAAADVNGDGNLDLVVGDANGGGIVLLLGNGNGTFQASRTVVGSGDYQAVGVADMNTDGHLDVVGYDVDNGAVQVWPGNGNGTFQASQTLGTAGYGYGLVIGNFANGGSLGVAVPNSNSNEAVVFLQAVSLTPASQSFGTVNVGSSSSAETFTLTNSSGNSVTVSAVSFAGTNPTDFSETDNCTSSPVAAGGTCTINVTFTPGASGSRSATLSVTDNVASSPQSATLTGTGVGAPIASLSPAGLSFGSQNDGSASASQQITLTNTGNTSLTGLTITITGTNSGDFGQTNNCSSTLTATSSCTINVTFSPTIAGSESASVQFADNASNSPQTVSLSGTGVALAPAVSLGPTSLTFTSQSLGTTSTAQPVTLTNTGNASLTGISVSVIGANAADFHETDNCAGNTITANGGTCMISVQFAPSVVGAENASVRITDNAASSPQTISLSGTGVQIATHLAYVQAAPSPIVAGSSIGTIQVGVYDFRPALVTGSSASVQVTIIGPNSFSTSQTQSAVNGVATFNFSSVPLDADGVYTVSAVSTSPSLPAVSSQTTVTALLSSEQIVVSGFPSPTYLRVPHNVTVSVEDSYGNVITSYTGNMTLSTSDSAGTVAPSTYAFTGADQGTHTFVATMGIAGIQSITATDGTLTGSETNITVNPRPQFVVNTLADDGGTAPCDGNEACSLRSAIAQANTLGAGDITFDSTQLGGSAPWTSTLTNGLLELSSNITIVGPGSGAGLSISGNNASQVFQVDASAAADIANLTITGGSSASNGGAITNAGTLVMILDNVTNSTATHNGGGIYNTGSLSLSQSTVSGNTAQVNGAGISNAMGLTIANSTLSGNTATGNGGAVDSTGTLNINQSTLSGNTATDGSGVENESSATATVTQSTVSANTATGQNGATFSNQNSANGAVTITNSIIAGNTAPGGDCGNCGQQSNFNLFSASTSTIDLGQLANNGSVTQTMVPLVGSPAIGAGSVPLALDINNQPLSVDQRQTGYARVVNNAVDLGAVQSNAGPAATLAFALPTSVVAGTPQTVVVSLLTPAGNPAATYTGTVTFTSTDLDAQLPANYTFTAADAGSHSFSVTLETAGSQTVTVADTVTTSLHASQTITVGASAGFTVTAVSGSGQSAIVGAAFATAMSVRVTDSYGNTVSGVAVVFTAPATGASGAFGNSGNSISVQTNSSGVATAPAFTANNATGQYAVTASVQGIQSTASFSLSNLVRPDFSIVANPTTLTVEAGQSGAAIFTVTPVGGYSGTVQFTCSGLPTGASCAFQPAQLMLNGSNTALTTQLTIHTTGTNGVLSSHGFPVGHGKPPIADIVIVLSAAILFFLMQAGRKNRRISVRYSFGFGLIALGCALSIGLMGCGSAKPAAAVVSPSATPAGNYTVTVTAGVSGTSGTQHNASIAIMITQ